MNRLDIQWLDLSYNHLLNRYSGIYLGNMLLNNTTLTRLDLTGCTLETEGVNRIIEAIAFN